MKRILLTFLALFFAFGLDAFAQTHSYFGSSVIINTSSAIISTATDCTAQTAVAGVICFENDDNTVYACEPSAGNCDTAGEWTQIGYCNKAGCTYTGKVIFTTIKLTAQASPPGTPGSGEIYVDSTPTPDELCFYDGAGWQGISSGTDANCQ